MRALLAARSIVNRFSLDEAPMLVSRGFRSDQLTATRLKTSNANGTGLTEPLHKENAYVVSTQLIPLLGNELWRAGKLEAKGAFLPGEIGIVNLMDDPSAFLPRGYDCVQFYIPAVLFDELADDNDMPRITELNFVASRADAVLPKIASALLPYLQQPSSAESLFFDHVALATYLHLARTYGSAKAATVPIREKLSKIQLRTAFEMMEGSLCGQSVVLVEVAHACGMPVERFVKAFKKTTGMAPFRWIQRSRVEKAKTLILSSDLPMPEIAFACGFADETQMSKAFRIVLGLDPIALRT